MEAYYYLGLKIAKSDSLSDIKAFLWKAQSERKARDTWKGSLRIYELFGNQPKETILQLQYMTFTHIVKLVDHEYTQLLESVRV